MDGSLAHSRSCRLHNAFLSLERVQKQLSHTMAPAGSTLAERHAASKAFERADVKRHTPQPRENVYHSLRALASQRASGDQDADSWLGQIEEEPVARVPILEDYELIPDTLVQLQRVLDAFVAIAPHTPKTSFPQQLAALSATAAALPAPDGTSVASARRSWLGAGGGARVEAPAAAHDRRAVREATLATGNVPTGSALERIIGRKPRGTNESGASSHSSESASMPDYTSEIAANAAAVAGMVRGAAARPSDPQPAFDPSGGASLVSPPSSAHSSEVTRPVASFTAELAAIKRTMHGSDSHIGANPMAPSDFMDANTLPFGGGSGLSSPSGSLSGFMSREQFSAALPPSPRGSGLSGRGSAFASVRRYLRLLIRKCVAWRAVSARGCRDMSVLETKCSSRACCHCLHCADFELAHAAGHVAAPPHGAAPQYGAIQTAERRVRRAAARSDQRPRVSCTTPAHARHDRSTSSCWNTGPRCSWQRAPAHGVRRKRCRQCIRFSGDATADCAACRARSDSACAPQRRDGRRVWRAVLATDHIGWQRSWSAVHCAHEPRGECGRAMVGPGAQNQR